MKDAHPVCVVSFFPSRTPLLTVYVENRQEWLEAVRQLHPTTTQDYRKTLFRAAFHRVNPCDMYVSWCRQHKPPLVPAAGPIVEKCTRLAEPRLRPCGSTRWSLCSSLCQDVTASFNRIKNHYFKKMRRAIVSTPVQQFVRNKMLILVAQKSDNQILIILTF